MLGTGSQYFQKMLQNDIKEANDGIWEPQNLTPSQAETLAEYISGRKITIDWEDAEDYLPIADSYTLDWFKKELQDYIVDNLDLHNIHWWANQAIQGIYSVGFETLTSGIYTFF